MKSAIQRSIYYADVNNFNPVITFNYNDEASFKSIIQDFPNNIEIVATFGIHNQCYHIFNELPYLYKKLLFDKTTSIYLVSRKGLSICLFREKLENERIAVIQIDSVLAEYSPTSYKTYFFYPLTFVAGALVSWKYFSEK